jgi:hypothetical protein
MIIKRIMKTSNIIIFSAFCLLTLLTACKGMTHRQNSQGQAEIIMEKSERSNDSTAFKYFEGDSIHTFCLTKSDKVLGAWGYNPIERDIVTDSLSAVLIAKAAWYPIYGKEHIEREKPFRVTEYIKYWTVEGTLPEGYAGGTAHIVIRKSDGKVMEVWHDK